MVTLRRCGAFEYREITKAGLFGESWKKVRQGRVDALAVYKLDRLGRSLQHLA
jgi:DNA invertase Pin-like site-specific DNA recombinase